MPALRHYTITQVREVKVTSTNSSDAILLGSRVLAGTKRPEDQVNVRSEIRETSFMVREDD